MTPLSTVTAGWGGAELLEPLSAPLPSDDFKVFFTEMYVRNQDNYVRVLRVNLVKPQILRVVLENLDIGDDV